MRTRALLATCGVLIAAAMPAILAGGCTGMSTESKTAAMAPAPRAKATEAGDQLRAGDGPAPRQSRARELADVPRQLRRLGLQPARADHAGQRRRSWCRSGRSRPGVTEGHQAPPIVNNGVMFVTTPQQPGDRARRQDRRAAVALQAGAARGLLQLHPTNRGVGAVRRQGLYRPPSTRTSWRSTPRPARSSGTRRSRTTSKGYYMTLAPLVAEGKVMVGVSGGELGIRGFVAALDARTGQRRVEDLHDPGPGRARATTPGRGDTWKTGGVPVWVTGHLRSRSSTSRTGAPATPAPWMGDTRPGDNLYSNSVIALDADTGQAARLSPVPLERLVGLGRGLGAAAGRRQARRPHDQGPRAPGAERLSLAARAQRRRASRFVDAKPYVTQNVFTSIDPRTGRPTTTRAQARHRQAGDFCPSLWGGKDWPPAAYSPKTGLPLHPRQREPVRLLEGAEAAVRARASSGSASTIKDIGLACRGRAPDHIGELQAWDLSTRRSRSGRTRSSRQNWGPVLATGGGLVFAGGTNDRYFRAFDADDRRAALAVSAPTPASPACRPPSRSTACSTSPCSRAGASTRSACRAASTRRAARRRRAAGRRHLGVRGEEVS